MFSRLVILTKKLKKVLPLLNEKQRRFVIATEAKAWGWGGTETLTRITGMSRPAIRRGFRELGNPKSLAKGVRRPGGGRKKLTAKDPRLKRKLERLVDPATRGDPESLLRWSSKSARHLAQALAKDGVVISHSSVATLLHEMEYSLQANQKTQEGKDHPDRDRQFQYINQQAIHFLSKKNPVISVDTKKKELVGNYKNAGKEWERMVTR